MINPLKGINFPYAFDDAAPYSGGSWLVSIAGSSVPKRKQPSLPIPGYNVAGKACEVFHPPRMNPWDHGRFNSGCSLTSTDGKKASRSTCNITRIREL